MLTPRSDFERLMERARAGCPEAAQELFDRFGGHVRQVVRRHLHDKMRRIYDSVDFTQSVWAAFFQAQPEGYSFSTPDELIAFLSTVATNKVIDAHRRRLYARKHDLAREQSLDAPPPQAPNAPLAEQLAGRQPSPSQVAIAEETREGLFRRAPAAYREALEMLRQGHSQREVAEKLGLHPKMLQRILQQLRSKMGLP